MKRPDGGPRETLVLLGLLVALAAALVPIVATPVPPLIDYPNHLARYWLISGGDRIPPVDRFYRVDWSRASTDIGIDLIFRFAGNLADYRAIAKLVLVAALVGPPFGAVMLNRVMFGRWHWWQFGFLVLAWTTTSLFGFLAYQVSLTAALLFACLDPLLPSRPLLRSWLTGLLARLAFGVVILLFHPFGLAFYGVLVAAIGFGPGWAGLRRPARLARIALAAATALLVVLVPVLLLGAFAPTLPSGGHHGIWWLFTLKDEILTAASPFLSYRWSVDLACAVPPLAVFAVAAATGRARSHAGLVLAGIVLALLSLVMPAEIGDATWLRRRLPLMAALVLFASLQPEPVASNAGRRVLATLMLAVAVGRSLFIEDAWRARSRDVAAIERALDDVPAGASIFTLQVVRAGTPGAPTGRYLADLPGTVYDNTLRHVPALVVPWRHAFIPTLFTVPGQQPLRVLPPWNELAVESSRIPDVHALDGSDPDALRTDPYLRFWRTRFDFVILIGADQRDVAGPFRMPQGLVLVSDTGFARLYRISRAGAGAPR